MGEFIMSKIKETLHEKRKATEKSCEKPKIVC